MATSANCILAFPDYVMADRRFAIPSAFGGGWSNDLPLSNLLRSEFAYVARSIDTALSSTQFWLDLGVLRDVRGVFIPRTNGSRDCRYRIRGFSTPLSSLGGVLETESLESLLGEDGDKIFADGSDLMVDSGWNDLYQPVYELESLYWGHPSLWDGKISSEDAVFYPMPVIETFEEAAIAQYWLVEFDDTNNADGYLEIPRIIISGGWEPAINMSWGANLATEDQSIPQEAIGGAMFFEDRPSRRIARFTLGFMSHSEALTWVADMQRRLGTRGEIFFVFDPNNRTHIHRSSFLSRMRTLSPLEWVAFDVSSAPFELQEIVA